MSIHLIIIGDEILNGKRQDKHMQKAIELLAERRLSLDGAQYIKDDPSTIQTILKQSFAQYHQAGDLVCCFGGIGATPDDHTRAACAAALGEPLLLHPIARDLIAHRITQMIADGKADANLQATENIMRFKMAELPQSAQLVPNPYNQIPGFYVGRHFFLPGFPVMAAPMLAWILDNHAPQVDEETIQSFFVLDMPESLLADILYQTQAAFDVQTFSLPSFGDKKNSDWRSRPHIEVGVKKKGKSNTDFITQALGHIAESIQALGYTIMPEAKDKII